MKTGRILTTLLFTLLLALHLGAEGTRQLSGEGQEDVTFIFHNGKDGNARLASYGCAPRERLYVHLKNNTEKIYLGFNLKSKTESQSLYYRVRGPVADPLAAGEAPIVLEKRLVPGDAAGQQTGVNGYIDNYSKAVAGPYQFVGGSGYIPLVIENAGAGYYYIEFNFGDGDTYQAVSTNQNGAWMPFFDVTVADGGVVKDGRVFMYQWPLYNKQDGSGFNDISLNLYAYHPTDSSVTQLQMQDVRPGGFNVLLTDHGLVDNGNITEDRKSKPYAIVSKDTPSGEFPIFLQDPDPQLYPSAQAQPYVLLGGYNNCSGSSCLQLFVSKAGQVEVLLDLNGTAGYQEGTEDVLLTEKVVVGDNCINWDGLNGLGVQVGSVEVNVELSYRTGELHLPLGDFEGNPNGFNMAITRPVFQGLTSNKIFWDDTALPLAAGCPNTPGVNLTGCDANCHSWVFSSTCFAESSWVNTWWFSTIQTRTATVLAVPACVEICDNQLDDDGDGLVDCEDGDCAFDVACYESFTCEPSLYQVISGELRKFDPATSTYEVIGPASNSYNGTGYNVQDDFIYGISGNNKGKYLWRIHPDGAEENLGVVPGLNAYGTYTADFDTLGNLHLYNKGKHIIVDVDAPVLSMTDITLTNLSTGSKPGMNDIVYNATNGLFYGMSNNHELWAIDPVANTYWILDYLTDYTSEIGTKGYGACWTDRDGTLYFSNNGTGFIYKVTLDEAGLIVYDMAKVAQGEVTNNNDGMSCPYAASVFGTEANCSDFIDNDGDGYVDLQDSDVQQTLGFDLTGGIGLDDAVDSRSMAWGDYDNDGDPDLFVTTYESHEPNILYRNNGNGRFSKLNNPAFANYPASSNGASWGDYDNDGDLDLFIANNFGFNDYLYRNEGGGVFTFVTGDPVTEHNGYSQAGSWADYDNDGFIDLFVTDYFSTKFNTLYHNNGDGTFTAVSTSALSNEASFSVAGLWRDFNNDGLQDILVVNTNYSANSLYLNTGGGNFEKVNEGTLTSERLSTVGASWGDYDNDGDEDVYIVNAGNAPNRLYRNEGNGNFTLLENSLPGQDKGHSHGSVWVDFNYDGWLDLLVTNDQGQKNLLYLNEKDGTFSYYSGSVLTEHRSDSWAVAFADYDNDGDEDAFMVNRGVSENNLFSNQINCNKSLCLNLVGGNSNYFGLGTRIEILAQTDSTQHWVRRQLNPMSGGGLSAQAEQEWHIGLGTANQVDSMIIHWPSGYTQRLGRTDIGDCLTVFESPGILLSGYTYHDENANGIFDVEERSIPNMPIQSPGMNMTIYSDANGYYEFFVEPGGIQLSGQEAGTWTRSTPDIAFAVETGQNYPNNNFGYLAACVGPDLSVEISSTAQRIGFENLIALTIRNEGAGDATNVQLSFESSQIEVLSTSTPSTNTGSQYNWELESLTAGSAQTIYLVNTINAELVTLGDSLSMSAAISAEETDCATENNSILELQEAIGALDPNDILVSPEGIIEEDTELIYKIRFQNVGNGDARWVEITNELPEELDIASLEIGATSHAYRFRREGRTLIWTFDNINLPDTLTDEPGSHGFVLYRISPAAGLGNGTAILNNADIYFDANPPMRTNTVENYIGSRVGNLAPGQLWAYPNPARERVYLQLNAQRSTGVDAITNVRLFDSMGRVVYVSEKIEEAGYTEVPVSRLTPGVYHAVVTTLSGTTYTAKVIRE